MVSGLVLVVVWGCCCSLFGLPFGFAWLLIACCSCGLRWLGGFWLLFAWLAGSFCFD